MIYFTGDTHGDIQRLSKHSLKNITEKDTLIVCGDFGFIWDNSKSEKKNLDKIEKLKFNVCFVDGTHENFDLLGSYPCTEWHGGKVHKIRKNIFHLMRGQIFDINGEKVFALGGGESPELEFKEDVEITDRPEVPDKSEMLEAVNNLEKTNYEIDYIVTHEPPAKVRDFILLSATENSTVTALGAFLDELAAQAKFKRWFFGSLHTDKHISASITSVFTDIISGR